LNRNESGRFGALKSDSTHHFFRNAVPSQGHFGFHSFPVVSPIDKKKKKKLTFFLATLSLYIFTIWKCIVYNRFCRDGIYFNKILVSEYKLFKRSNKANILSASFLDLFLEFDDSGQLSTKIYDKRDDFNFKNINFPNMCNNIPASPAYGVYISQLIWFPETSSSSEKQEDISMEEILQI
jgi:hypothetical protein